MYQALWGKAAASRILHVAHPLLLQGLQSHLLTLLTPWKSFI